MTLRNISIFLSLTLCAFISFEGKYAFAAADVDDGLRVNNGDNNNPGPNPGTHKIALQPYGSTGDHYHFHGHTGVWDIVLVPPGDPHATRILVKDNGVKAFKFLQDCNWNGWGPVPANPIVGGPPQYNPAFIYDSNNAAYISGNDVYARKAGYCLNGSIVCEYMVPPSQQKGIGPGNCVDYGGSMSCIAGTHIETFAKWNKGCGAPGVNTYQACVLDDYIACALPTPPPPSCPDKCTGNDSYTGGTPSWNGFTWTCNYTNIQTCAKCCVGNGVCPTIGSSNTGTTCGANCGTAGTCGIDQVCKTTTYTPPGCSPDYECDTDYCACSAGCINPIPNADLCKNLGDPDDEKCNATPLAYTLSSFCDANKRCEQICKSGFHQVGCGCVPNGTCPTIPGCSESWPGVLFRDPNLP